MILLCLNIFIAKKGINDRLRTLGPFLYLDLYHYFDQNLYFKNIMFIINKKIDIIK